MTVCSLRKRNAESHVHLFFNCQFTSAISKKLKEMMQVQSNTAGWGNIINEFADMPNKSSVWRIEVVLEMICETVRLKLMGLTVKNTKAVQLVAKKWNVVLKVK
ncbi:hypothetical protein Tco_1098646 [Tanacetum coccineum]